MVIVFGGETYYVHEEHEEHVPIISWKNAKSKFIIFLESKRKERISPMKLVQIRGIHCN